MVFFENHFCLVPGDVGKEVAAAFGDGSAVDRDGGDLFFRIGRGESYDVGGIQACGELSGRGPHDHHEQGAKRLKSGRQVAIVWPHVTWRGAFKYHQSRWFAGQMTGAGDNGRVVCGRTDDSASTREDIQL